MSLQLASIEFFFSPPLRGAPDDIRKIVINIIDSAQKKVWIASQQLEHIDVVDALIRAKLRGLNIAVLLERDFFYERKRVEDPWRKVRNGNEENRRILLVLMRAGIKFSIEHRSVLMHSNFIITESEVLFTSANFTETGLEENFNSHLVVKNKVFLERFSDEFRRIENEQLSEVVDEPAIVKIGDLFIKIIFGPRHSPEMEIMKQMLKAKKRIDIAVFTFSSSSGIDDTLLSLARSGVKIRLIVDSDQVNQRWSPVPELRSSGVEIRHIGGRGKRLHHKLIVIDDKTVIMGTFNFTKSARLSNESIIVLGIHKTEGQKITTDQKKISNYARKEINRIFDISYQLD